MTIIVLEIGDKATPLVDVSYVDPTLNVELTYPTAGEEGTVINRIKNGVDTETETPIYTYNIQYVPALTTTYTIEVEQPGGGTAPEERTATNDLFWMDNEDLGLAPDAGPVVDTIAWQQTVNEAQQVSRTSTDIVRGVADEVLRDDPATTTSYGRQEIVGAAETTQKNDEIIQASDVLGPAGEDQLSTANENRIGADILGSDQQLYVEYVDNLYAMREVLKDIDSQIGQEVEQTQEQTARGFEEDVADSDEFVTQYLNQTVANTFTAPVAPDPDYDAIKQEKDARLLENYEKTLENIDSTLLNPPVFEETHDPIVIDENQPITPPGEE